MSNYGYPIIGLAALNEESINKQFNDQAFEIVKGLFFKGNAPKKSEWWAYYVQVGRHDALHAPYGWSWEQDPQPWNKIMDGTLAQELKGHLLELDSMLRRELPKKITSDLPTSS